MRKWNRTSALCVFLAAALLSGGCGAFGSEDDDPDVAGSYTASTFTAETDTSTVGVLEAGGSLRITLNEDGTASGRLRVPCSLPGACEPDEGPLLDVSFEGIYEVDGRTVTFRPPGRYVHPRSRVDVSRRHVTHCFRRRRCPHHRRACQGVKEGVGLRFAIQSRAHAAIHVQHEP